MSAVNDELLSAVGKLAAEYGRIGGNLNQIARYLNEYGAPYNALSGEVHAAIADLAALKYEILQKVGDAVGNTQAYRMAAIEAEVTFTLKLECFTRNRIFQRRFSKALFDHQRFRVNHRPG